MAGSSPEETRARVADIAEIQGLGDVSESEESCCHGNMLSVGVASFDWFESANFYALIRPIGSVGSDEQSATYRFFG